MAAHPGQHGVPVGVRARIEDAMGRMRVPGVLPVAAWWRCWRRWREVPLAVPCLGASGAIAAVMGAFIVIFPRDRIRSFIWIFIFIRVTYIPAVWLIGVWFVIQLWNAGAVANVQSGGVAYLAHAGGFLFGVVTARLWEAKGSLQLLVVKYRPQRGSRWQSNPVKLS